MLLFDFSSSTSLARVLSTLPGALKPLISLVSRTVISRSSQLGSQARHLISGLIGTLTASSPLRNVPQAAGCPVLGILPQMCNQGLYSTTMTMLFDLARDSGLSCSWVSSIPIVYLRDPAVIRQVYVSNAESVTRFGSDGKGPFGISQRMIGYTVATADGDDWHRWRKGFLKHFNNQAALARSYPDLLDIAKRHVQRLVDLQAGPDLRQSMEDYALDSVWYIALGLDDISASSGELRDVMEDYTAIVGSPSHLWRHAVRNLVAGKPFGELDAVERAIRDRIYRMIANLVSSNLGRCHSETPGSSLLQSVSRACDGSAPEMTAHDVLSQVRQVFSLGHEASALILFWGLYELSLQPAAVDKLRAELGDHDCSWETWTSTLSASCLTWTPSSRSCSGCTHPFRRRHAW